MRHPASSVVRSLLFPALMATACVPVARAQAPVPPAPAPAAPAATSTADLPPIAIEPAVLDLGFMAPRAGGKGSVTLRNTGTAPLTIAAVTPSCKCTTTTALAGKVIPPGGSETLEAVLEGASMPQLHRATIKVAIDGYARVLEVQLRGETAMPVRSVPSIINAVEGKPRQGRIVVESLDKKPFRVCAVGGQEPQYIGFEAGAAPRAQYLLKYDLDAWQPKHPSYLVIETDRPDCPVFDVWVRSEDTIPRSVFRMKDYRLNAGRISVGGSADLSSEMDDPGEEILAVECGSPEIQVELLGQSVKDGIRTVNLRVTPKGPRTGMIYAPVRLFGRERDQQLTLFGTVRAPDAAGCDGCNPAKAPAPAAGGDAR
ncbi:MAG: DUF1573 domain-containing protein [Planctomycetota bacterium]